MKLGVRCVALLVAGLVSSVGCSGVGTVLDDKGVLSQGLIVPSAVANMSPNGLVESTGNLYWTQNSMTGTFPYRWTGRVYRAAKTSVPGQEIVLYSEAGLLGSSFGNLTYANWGGIWYGYFLASQRLGSTVVKRVPLDGSSPAITWGDSPSLASPGSALMSDGMWLFFYGANGLYAAPLDGGRTVTVVSATGITGLGFDRMHLYYSIGNAVHWAFKPSYGNQSGLVSTEPDPITAMYVQAGADNDDSKTEITVGTAHGVYIMSYLTGHNTAMADGLRFPTWPHTVSVSAAGSRIMWTACESDQACWANYMDRSADFNHFTGVEVQTGARSITGDATQMFFIDNYALERLSY